MHTIEEGNNKKEEGDDNDDAQLFEEYFTTVPNLSGNKSAQYSNIDSKYSIRLHRIKGSTADNIDESLIWTSTNKTSCLPSKKLLASTDVYILDAHSEIYVRYGKKASNYCRQIALLLANNMLQDEDVHRPTWATIEEIKENTEPVLFKARFYDWTDGSENQKKPKDFRSAHQVILDQIRKRGALNAEMFLPNINPATLFPEVSVLYPRVSV